LRKSWFGETFEGSRAHPVCKLCESRIEALRGHSKISCPALFFTCSGAFKSRVKY
jgi:hypothetical protein